MNSIKRVKIENFQSHAFSELNFSDGLNVIVGPTDNGKSVIIRAIKWCLFNIPRGTEFIRHGTNSVKVEVEMSNGYTITRERTPSKNRYLLTTPDNKTEVYEGIGNEIPDEIKKAHKITEVMLDDTMSMVLNISNQLEAPFLLSNSDQVKAKAIGTLTGVNIIDSAVRDTSNEHNSLKQSAKKIREELDQVTHELQGYDGLEAEKKYLDICEQSINDFEKSVNKYEKLKKLNDKLKIILFSVSECKDIIDKYQNIDTVVIKLNNLETETMSNLNKLRRIKKSYDEKCTNILNGEKYLKNLGNVVMAEVGVKAMESLCSHKKEIEKLQVKYNEILVNEAKANLYIKSKADEIETLKKQYKENLKKLGKCPVCFSQIDDEAIERVMKEQFIQ